MKVLFVFNHPLGAPAFAVLQYFPTQLVKMGHQAIVAAPEGGETKLWDRAGVKVIQLPDPRKHPLDWLRGLRNISKTEQPTIIHVFIHAGCGLYPPLMKISSSQRFVLDIRSPLLRTGFARRFIQLKNQLEVLPYNAISTHGIESAWTVIGKHHRTHWVPPGVDLKQIPARESSRHSTTSAIRMVYVGALNHTRNLDVMLRATIMAAKEVNITLDVYGYGDGLESLERIVDRFGVRDRIRLKGSLPKNDLMVRLPDYDIGLSYVPNALYNPALPLKTLEYLGAGLAVLATRTDGHSSIIIHGHNGIIVNEDEKSFAQGIIQLAQDSALREHLSHNSRKSVECFDWEAIVRQRLLPIYEGLNDY